MAKLTYVDFDLQIEPRGQGYRALVTNSLGSGPASHNFDVAFQPYELELLLARLGGTRQRVRTVDAPEVDAAKELGSRLFNMVFDEGVRDRLLISLNEARRQDVAIRIRLHLANAPQLASLPWEYLYNAASDRFLALSGKTALVRYLESPETPKPLRVAPPLRVLVMISSPNDADQLDVEREWNNLQQALGNLVRRGAVILERTEHATLAHLQQRLRRNEYHIFHFIGHGTFDRHRQDGVLLLENEAGASRRVGGRDLGVILYDHKPLRLALLNACEGAQCGKDDVFAGVAQNLIRQDTPAVVAMQFPITDEAAITFAKEFYGAIADNYPVDAALAEARKAIFAQGNYLEWGTPVLFLSAPDGRIFDVDTTMMLPTTPPQHPRIGVLRREAQEAIAQKQWTEAKSRLHELLKLAPNDPEATTSLQHVEQQLQQLGELWREAQAAMDQEQWATATERYQALLMVDQNNAEAANRLRWVLGQQEFATLYTRGRASFDARRWQEALDVFYSLRNKAGQYRDVPTLIAAAEHELAQASAGSVPSRSAPSALPVQDRSKRRGGLFWFSVGSIMMLVVVILSGVGFMIWAVLSSNASETTTDTQNEAVELPVDAEQDASAIADEVVRSHLQAIQDQNYEAAYELLDPSLQEELPFEEFATSTVYGFDITSVSSSESEYVVETTIDSTDSAGSSQTFAGTFLVGPSNDEWKIISVQLE